MVPSHNQPIGGEEENKVKVTMDGRKSRHK
jgi:hypothetical protein